MPFPAEQYSLWSSQVTLLATDTTKTILAAPSGALANRAIVVTTLVVNLLVSGAQATDIRGSSGTVFLIRIPASPGVWFQWYMGPLNKGIPLPVGDSLVIVPAAAAPSFQVIAEGFYQ